MLNWFKNTKVVSDLKVGDRGVAVIPVKQIVYKVNVYFYILFHTVDKIISVISEASFSPRWIVRMMKSI